MKIEFEVGKKYKNILFPSGIYTCTFLGQYRAFLEASTDEAGSIPHLNNAYEMGWREHKEPVVHKRTLIWYKVPPARGGEINITTKYTSKQLEKWGYEILKVEEISCTEGE